MTRVQLETWTDLTSFWLAATADAEKRGDGSGYLLMLFNAIHWVQVRTNKHCTNSLLFIQSLWLKKSTDMQETHKQTKTYQKKQKTAWTDPRGPMSTKGVGQVVQIRILLSICWRVLKSIQKNKVERERKKTNGTLDRVISQRRRGHWVERSEKKEKREKEKNYFTPVPDLEIW